MAASLQASVNEVKCFTGNPNSTSVSSSNDMCSPKILLSIVAAAVDITLCPLVYSGNGGVCNKGRQFP